MEDSQETLMIDKVEAQPHTNLSQLKTPLAAGLLVADQHAKEDNRMRVESLLGSIPDPGIFANTPTESPAPITRRRVNAPTSLLILVACEMSGIVSNAFAALGHTVWSCDLMPSESYAQHYQGDVRDMLSQSWDLMIGFPPCTYLANSGSKHLYNGMSKAGGINPVRWRNMLEGVEFFKLLRSANIPRIAIENPVMHEHARRRIGYPTQYIQPYWFGHNETKKTGLWLKNLPRLLPTNFVEGPYIPRVHHEPPGPMRQINRSRTYEGIASAMAHRWGTIAEDNYAGTLFAPQPPAAVGAFAASAVTP